MCKLKADTNYTGTPHALGCFGGVQKDIFPELSPAQQRKIAKSYDLDMDVFLPTRKLRTVFPEEWKENIELRKLIRKLPLHRVTVPWKCIT